MFETEEIDSDSDDEVKNDVPAPVRKRVASTRTAVTPNAGMASPTTRIKYQPSNALQCQK